MSSVLECVEVKKSFFDAGRELRILNGVSLQVQEHEILAISGPSGVGKSTLLHLMGTLDTPTEGTILLRGTPLQNRSPREINRIRNQQIGFIFQFYHLLPEFTALENVMMPGLCAGASPATCRDRAAELLAKVGLADRLTHKPGQLSGGEQQRVAIARALFNRPAIVLADEPTGNLDEKTGAEVAALLWELNRTESMTLVLVTHDEQLAAQAHHWITLHEGKAYVKK